MKSLLGVILLACFILIGSLSRAEEVVVVPSTTPRVEVRENSSEHYRMNKNFELVFSPFSFGGWGMSNSGITAGYFINRNSLVTMSYSRSISGKSCWGEWSCELNDRYYSAAYKRFVSNTFYIEGGASMHRLYTSETDDMVAQEYSFDADIVTADFTIGNQWSFGEFTLGADWLTVAVPVSAEFKNSYANSSGAQGEMDSLQHTWKTQTRGYTLRFYLGATF